MGEHAGAIRTRRPELDRAFQHLVDLATAVDLTGIADPELQNLRIAREAIRRYGDVGPQAGLDDVEITPVVADGVPGEWVTTADADNGRRIVYLHGGGWRSGAPSGYRRLAATLARLSGASVLMVDYRLAPEHRFPAGLDDCVAAFRWAVQNGPRSADHGLADADPAERIHLAGDSAGGNLSAATCLRLVAEGARVPDRLALIAGTLDNVETERRVGSDDLICQPSELQLCTKMYLPDGHSAADQFVSPVHAAEELLRRFPPTLIQVSAIEALAWDSRLFAGRLEEGGVRYALSVWPDLPHVWHQFLGLFPEAEQALGEIADFFAR